MPGRGWENRSSLPGPGRGSGRDTKSGTADVCNARLTFSKNCGPKLAAEDYYTPVLRRSRLLSMRRVIRLLRQGPLRDAWLQREAAHERVLVAFFVPVPSFAALQR